MHVFNLNLHEKIHICKFTSASSKRAGCSSASHDEQYLGRFFLKPAHLHICVCRYAITATTTLETNHRDFKTTSDFLIETSSIEKVRPIVAPSFRSKVRTIILEEAKK